MNADLFFHGTSAKQAAQIKKGGFNSAAGNPKWNVSDAKNYFLSYRMTKREHDCEGKESTLRACWEEASFHAAFAAACDGSDSCVIFAVNLRGLKYEQDSSCCYPNAVEVSKRVPRNRIVGAWHSKQGIQVFAPFTIHNVIGNRYFDPSCVSHEILTLAKNVSSSVLDIFGGYYDMLFD